MISDKESIAEAIVKDEARLAELDEERRGLLKRVQLLRAQFEALDQPEASVETSSFTPSEKISLFRSLFLGRNDVFPKLWTNRVGGKGYAPACSNDLKDGLCSKGRKPRIPCSECRFQNYIPLSDSIIRDHLQGKHVIGVYPLLPDDTCWFVAADFDKDLWQEDVAAFCETCKSLEISIAVERSRSGNGAHVWFFFTEPVPAALARNMVCYLITETMSRRHQLSMNSYDRLIPSQDTMPRGGFGNLIALPLQLDRRQLGNSVFVDENFCIIPNNAEILVKKY